MTKFKLEPPNLFNMDETDYSEEENECIICKNDDSNIEVWYLSWAYGKWAYSECSHSYNPKDYISNFAWILKILIYLINFVYY